MKRNKNIKRRIRRKVLGTLTGSIITILMVATLATMLGLHLDEFRVTRAEAYASEKLEQASKKQLTLIAEDNRQLVDENQALEAKLNRSASSNTPGATKELVRFYIRKHFGAAAPTAEKVFTCESGLNPQAVNINTGAHAGSADRGVAQVNDKFHRARFERMYGVSFQVGAHDISLNIQYAKYLYDHAGWNPWVCRKVLN